MKLLNSNKFIFVVMILNIVVIVFLGAFIFFLKCKEKPVLTDMRENDTIDRFDYGYADDSLSNIYMALIENTSAELDNGLYYRFGEDGLFSGFFDADHPEVTNYKYKIAIEQKDILLTIYNREETRSVTYTLLIMEDGGMALEYPGFKTRIFIN